MKISSQSFEDEEEIPPDYTCDGEDISPPLSITDVPSEAESLALVVDDPDAPGGVFDHWLIWNIPSDLDEIPEHVPTEELVESLDNAAQGRNDFGEIGYRGPCPPGGTHKYRFKLYALDSSLDLSPGASKEDLEREMEDHILSEDQLIGLYSR